MLKLPAFTLLTHLPHSNPCVRIHDGGHTAVGVHGYIRLMPDLSHPDSLDLIRDIEPLEDDNDLPRVGAAAQARNGDRLQLRRSALLTVTKVASPFFIWAIE